ncbi:MAG TPA: hypothetical protein VIX37_13350 [Candidatus Sulfotelmatobacter sp.]
MWFHVEDGVLTLHNSTAPLKKTQVRCTFDSIAATRNRRATIFRVHTSQLFELDASVYPRTYRVSSGYFAFLSLLSGLVIIPGCLGIWYFGTGHETRGPRDAAIMVSLCVLFVLLGACLLVSLLRFPVTLGSDSIEVRGFFTSHRVLRTEVAGFRILPTQYIATVVVVPRDAHQKTLKFSRILKTDGAYDAWFGTIPNLDTVERAESRAQLSADPDLGVLPDERTDRIKQAAQFARTTNAITLVAAFWALVYPRPYLPVIAALALLPLVVIFEFVRSKGLYNLQGRRNEARPSVALALILPGPILMLRALRDIHLLHWQSVIPAAVILAAVLIVIVAPTSTRSTRLPFPPFYCLLSFSQPTLAA